jgi:hypothetical protein
MDITTSLELPLYRERVPQLCIRSETRNCQIFTSFDTVCPLTLHSRLGTR